MPGFLQKHISFLLNRDPFFVAFWDGLGKEGQLVALERLSEIDLVARSRFPGLGKLHSNADDITRRFFVVVQEEEFQYTRIPRHWVEFVRDKPAKEGLFSNSLSELERFLRSYEFDREIRLYGGIKPDESIDRKYGIAKKRGGMQKINDLWDVVRFRMVAESISDVRSIAVRLWMSYFENVVRCRNYYFRPKNGDGNDPYRAVHFELEIFPRKLIEIQVMTRSRELLCYLDYAPHFKGHTPFTSWRQRRWLTHFSQKANVYDCQKIIKF